MISLPGRMRPSKTERTGFFIFCITVLICTGTTTFASAKDYTFSWSANAEPVAGYKLYYKKGGEPGPPYNGSDSPLGPSPIDVGKKTTFTITGLEDNTTYHFTLTAYEGTTESDFAQVITISPQSNSPAPSIIGIKILP